MTAVLLVLSLFILGAAIWNLVQARRMLKGFRNVQ